MTRAGVAVIGGSGFYQMEGMTDLREEAVETPFGPPSDTIRVGTLEGHHVAFLPRHGPGHRIMPTEVPGRANVYALKTLGVRQVISISAVGSLRADIEPQHLVVPDQLIDRTRNRISTFFGEGLVAHVSFADPFCPELSSALVDAAREVGATVHRGGTYVCIEGPAFSTRAESNLYRQWGADIIGMTALPEAKLAREAEICYATIACCTDYDVWHDTHADVTAEMILGNLLRNVDVSKRVVRAALRRLPDPDRSRCSTALQDALVTARERIPPEALQRLTPIVGRYLQ